MNLEQAYRILQLRYGSPRPEVVAAFRRLALAMHPDHATLAGVAPADANAAFIEVRRAYETIAHAGFPVAKMPPPPPPPQPTAPAIAKPRLHPPTPNVSTWKDVNDRLRRQDAAERAAARAEATASSSANEDSERCVFVRLEISTAP